MSDPITTPATGPGAGTHLIQVQYDPSTLSLDVSLSSASINPGDTVVWNFFGIPTGWTPWIEFRRSATTPSPVPWTACPRPLTGSGASVVRPAGQETSRSNSNTAP